MRRLTARFSRPAHIAKAAALAVVLIGAGCSDAAGSLEAATVDTTSGAPAPTFAPDTGAPERGSNVNVFSASIRSDVLTSARFIGTFLVSSPELGEDMTITISGAFDSPNEAATMEMDFGDLTGLGAGQDVPPEAMAMFDEPMRMITIGDVTWMQWSLLSMLGVESGMWLETDSDNPGESVGFENPIDAPVDLLSRFADADATIEDLGSETLRGVETTHYLATVDLVHLAETMSAEELAELHEDFGSPDELPLLPIDIWIDADGRLHKFEMHLDASTFDASAETGSMTMTYEIFDHGQDLGITPPDPANVVTEADFGFGFD